jgi:molybdate transport system ATP-binding protein
MVFQEYLLFPFLSVLDNVAFGLRSQKLSRHEARRRAQEWLARMGLADRAHDRPSDLSGGQAQRVALARALATEPHVLLLDEPLAALDAGARIEVRNELRSQLRDRGGPRLLVTHDPVDAASLCDRVVIVEEGRFVQQGAMAEIALHPRSRYVADLVGLNFYRGVARHGTVALSAAEGAVVIADRVVHGPVFVAFHPRSVTLQRSTERVSARNQWAGTVASIDQLGDRARVQVDGPVPLVAEVTAEALQSLSLAPGSEVVAAVKATELDVYGA